MYCVLHITQLSSILLNGWASSGITKNGFKSNLNSINNDNEFKNGGINHNNNNNINNNNNNNDNNNHNHDNNNISNDNYDNNINNNVSNCGKILFSTSASVAAYLHHAAQRLDQFFNYSCF